MCACVRVCASVFLCMTVCVLTPALLLQEVEPSGGAMARE